MFNVLCNLSIDINILIEREKLYIKIYILKNLNLT